jgi:AmmeMemoRadiSam system protein A
MTGNATERGATLLAWGRARLAEELGGPPAQRPEDAWCMQVAATFVSVRWRDGALQGCIGTLEPRRPLVDDVEHNVIAAALHDPRSEPIALTDLDEVRIEVHILSALTPIPFDTEASALAALQPGVDGVVLEWRGHRATFLPVMWRQLPDPAEFMRELEVKAGLAGPLTRDRVKLWRYSVEHYEEPGVRSST